MNSTSSASYTPRMAVTARPAGNAPVIFLDIDGVLVTFDSMRAKPTFPQPFDPRAVNALKRIIRLTKAKIVVSSSWRLLHPKFVDLPRYFAHQSLPRPVGMTPDVRTAEEPARGIEIQTWIDRTRFKGPFVILDDSSDMAHLMNRLVLTDGLIGLTNQDATRAIEILRG